MCPLHVMCRRAQQAAGATASAHAISHRNLAASKALALEHANFSFTGCTSMVRSALAAHKYEHARAIEVECVCAVCTSM